jgi:hypothetical protein
VSPVIAIPQLLTPNHAAEVIRKQTNLAKVRNFHDMWWESPQPLFKAQQVEREAVVAPNKRVRSTCNVVPGHPFFPRGLSGGILYRKEYALLAKHLADLKEKAPYGTTVICGHPGIGMTHHTLRITTDA